MAYDPELFAGAAAFYDRHRAPYAQAAIDFAAERLGLTAASRLIDLGCGPGTLARRFAPRVAEVVAMDPDAGMLAEGAISPWAGGHAQYFHRLLEAVCEENGIPIDAPWSELTAKQRTMLLSGKGVGRVHVRYKNRYGRTRSYNAEYEGVVPWITRRHGDTDSDSAREQFEGYMREVPCPACKGARLKPFTLGVTIASTATPANP